MKENYKILADLFYSLEDIEPEDIEQARRAFSSELATQIAYELLECHYIKEDELDANYDYFDEMISDSLKDYLLLEKK